MHASHPSARYLTGYAGLRPDILDLFESLVAALSPENLSADGELPPAAVRARRSELERQWQALESFVGRPVSEDEVYQHLRAKESETESEIRDRIAVEAEVETGDMTVVENVAYAIRTKVTVPGYIAKRDPSAVTDYPRKVLAPPALAAGRAVSFSVTAHAVQGGDDA